jgi:hypothetical protein
MMPPSTKPLPAPVESAARRSWPSSMLYELFGSDLRSLAVLRIGLGIAVLADLAYRAFDFIALYTDEGLFPRHLLLQFEGREVLLSAHYWASAHPALQAALFAFTAACALALVAGWRTRLMTAVLWYLVSSVQVRQPLAYMGGDSILRLTLFWGMFLPLGARFSLDRAHGRVREHADRFVSLATLAVLLQICLVYWATGFRKSGPLWWSGRAVFYALHQEAWATPLGASLRQYGGLLEWLTYATLALELLGPCLAFMPVATAWFRLATIALFWSFHLGLASAMNIGLFPLFSMVAWLPFLPTKFWTWIGVPETTATAPAVTPGWRSRLSSVAVAVCLMYVVLLLAERARVLPRMIPAPVFSLGRLLRLQQTWNMFAPDPTPTSTRYVVTRHFSDGSDVETPATTSFRSAVFVSRLTAVRRPDEPFTRALRRLALAQCNTDSASPFVDRVTITQHRAQITDAGYGPVTTGPIITTPCSSD